MDYEPYLNDENFEFIYKNNYEIIEELKQIFKGKESVNVCAKGPTARHILNDECIGINQGLIFTNKRFLIINDLQSIFGIEHMLKDVEYLFIPDYPHIMGACLPEKDFRWAIRVLMNFNIKCKIFIYHIQTTRTKKRDNNFFFHTNSTTEMSFQIFKRFLNINDFETYGYKMGNKNMYHSEFEKLDYLQCLDVIDESYKNEIGNLARIYKNEYVNRKIHGIIDTNKNPEKILVPGVNRRKINYKMEWNEINF